MRGKRIAVLLAVAAGLLVLPTVELPDAPPPARASTATAVPRLTGAGYVASFDTDGVVAVSAVTDGRELQIRWQNGDGWSPWEPVEWSSEHAPDPGTAEASSFDPTVSEPVWVGDAGTVEVLASGPDAVILELVHLAGDLGYTAEPDVGSRAQALAIWPPIIPRYRWDPNGDCRPDSSPRLADRAHRVYVHHTVVFPHYEPHEADDVIRAICLGHVNRRGFSDIGYNFLIDAYGRIYQGRVGGILSPVVGAHAAGFNRGSVGVALVGDFETHEVPAAALGALDRLTAWLADLHDIEPYAVSGHVSTGGKTTRFEEGAVVELPTIVGHRDTALDSACPGDHLYEYVRGSNPIAPRVRAILQSHYGWSATDLAPPSAGEPALVAPSAGPRPAAGDDDAGGGLVERLSGLVEGPDSPVERLVRGAAAASELMAVDEP
ncbi:MAG: N-acetylmuramoyl-L-alanine amidase [Nitriliruptorales bacterium]|nr:N-acetylmuramoyl-L-alanine amidase [Nitriliruptorales bacterium]